MRVRSLLILLTAMLLVLLACSGSQMGRLDESSNQVNDPSKAYVEAMSVTDLWRNPPDERRV